MLRIISFEDCPVRDFSLRYRVVVLVPTSLDRSSDVNSELSIFFSMLLSNILFLTFGLIGTKLFARVTLIPRTFLWPSVFILASVGSYALQQSMLDVWVMLSFSFFGFILKRFGFSAAPIVIGLILGELVETSLKQSLVIFEGDWALFLNRPLVVVFFILTFMGLFWQTIRKGLIWIKKIVNINPR